MTTLKEHRIKESKRHGMDRNESEKEEKGRYINDMKEVSKERYGIKEICAEFENIIRKISSISIKKDFVQEDENLLEVIKRNFEEYLNLVKEEVKKGREPRQTAHTEATKAKKSENDQGVTTNHG